MLIFTGSRDEQGVARVFVSSEGQRQRPLPQCVHHSPDGFEWGYGGSGPADLALSILQAVLRERRTEPLFKGKCGVNAWKLHQRFKFARIATLPREAEWEMTEQQVLDWINENDPVEHS